MTADLQWWWNLLYAGLVVVGVAVQLRAVEARRETVRAAWMA